MPEPTACTCADGDDDSMCPDCEARAAFHLIGCKNPWHIYQGCPEAALDALIRQSEELGLYDY